MGAGTLLISKQSSCDFANITTGVDTGNVLAQEKVELAADDTLRTSYDKLSTAIEDLFETSILPTILKRGDFGAGTEQDETKVIYYLCQRSYVNK